MDTRLREMRTKHRFNQKKVADWLKISQSQYSMYETGKREIPIYIILKLAGIYGTSIDYLLKRTDNPELNTGRK